MGSIPIASSNKNGEVPEWPKGADCKSVVTDFDGSNPSLPTIKDSIVDTISAMGFCFICEKQLIFALLPLISVVLRAFFLVLTKNPPTSAPQRQKWRILYRSRVQSFKELFRFLITCLTSVKRILLRINRVELSSFVKMNLKNKIKNLKTEIDKLLFF